MHHTCTYIHMHVLYMYMYAHIPEYTHANHYLLMLSYIICSSGEDVMSHHVMSCTDTIRNGVAVTLDYTYIHSYIPGVSDTDDSSPLAFLLFHYF